jgi:hypothetical protein
MAMDQGYTNTFDPFGVAAFAPCTYSINISSLRDEEAAKKWLCMHKNGIGLCSITLVKATQV